MCCNVCAPSDSLLHARLAQELLPSSGKCLRLGFRTRCCHAPIGILSIFSPADQIDRARTELGSVPIAGLLEGAPWLIIIAININSY